eukprot:SAG31_NODE_204_length_20414_cov_19.143392_10_plen_148_part_00
MPLRRRQHQRAIRMQQNLGGAKEGKPGEGWREEERKGGRTRRQRWRGSRRTAAGSAVPSPAAARAGGRRSQPPGITVMATTARSSVCGAERSSPCGACGVTRRACSCRARWWSGSGRLKLLAVRYASVQLCTHTYLSTGTRRSSRST